MVHAYPPEAAEQWTAGLPPHEATVLFGDELDGPEALATLLSTPSLFGGPRVVVVRHGDRLSEPALEALPESLRRYPPAPEAYLVIWDETPEGRLRAALCEPPAGAGHGDARRAWHWVGSPGRSRRSGASGGTVFLAPAAAALMRHVEALAPARAPRELEKLAVYANDPPAPSLDLPQVRRLLSADLLEAVDLAALGGHGAPGPGGEGDFRRLRLADTVYRGRAAEAFSLAAALLEEGMPPAWIWGEVGRQAVLLVDVREQLEGRYGPHPARWPPEALRRTDDLPVARLPTPIAREKLATARCWDLPALHRVLEWVAQADHAAHHGLDAVEALWDLLLRVTRDAVARYGAGEPPPAPAASAGGS